MFKMCKAYTITIICILCFQTVGFTKEKAQRGESLTITTYYPSPYGSYNQLSVGAGGLRLGKVVDNVKANEWTDIDVNAKPSGGLYIVSVVPSDGDPFSTYMLLFAGGSQEAGLETFATHSSALSPKVSFRTRTLASSDSFTLQIKSKKNCNVHIGKILSYWEDKIK